MSDWLRRCVTIGVLLAPLTASAQGRFPPDTLTNLQVLPKSSTAADVITTMRQFSQSLGVRCQFCHLGKEGLPLDQFNFVSDDLAPKRTARAMLRLVQSLNAQLEKDVPSTTARVTCYTCHRGASKPLHAPEGANW